jgi:CRP-like cAMP-binding protein
LVGAKNETEHIDTLYKGDTFGEIGLLTKLRRSATIITLENCMMFEIDQPALSNI